MNMKKVTIYTDGACSGNPGKGGYGAVLVYGNHEKQISAGFYKTTNNRMELMAAIESLSLLKVPCEVTLFSDSKYLIDAMNKGWINNWVKNNWRKADNKPVLNVDLWKKIIKLNLFHNIEYVWVKGHDGNKYNEICDNLAVSAYNSENLSEDLNYKPE